MDQMITEKEAAEMLGISEFTLARLRKRREISSYRPSKRVIRYSLADVEAYRELVRHPARAAA